MKFFDTCALLDLQKEAFKDKFLICNITYRELEHIKTSGTKDEETKWKARQLLHLFKQYDNYKVLRAKIDDELLKEFDLEDNNDSRIILTAYRYYNTLSDAEKAEFRFVTSDISCEENAVHGVGLPTEFTNEDMLNDSYTGYEEIYLDDNELVLFYSDVLQNNKNTFNLLENEYLFIKDDDNNIIDKYKWMDNKYVKLIHRHAESQMFGKITPKDNYQLAALDSLYSNQVTVMRGKAGSGKSYLALGYLINQLEKGKIDKIVIFVNCVAVRGAARLGFYPGDKNSKMLDSQIGNFLISKFGDITEVERMIDEGTLVLVPVADCRGMDTSGMKAGILVTEAQNLSRDMIKLLLQRIGEDSIAVFEGDDKAQLDMSEYAGSNNGLRAMSKAFRGESLYGEVTLQIIHRSKIAEIAERI